MDPKKSGPGREGRDSRDRRRERLDAAFQWAKEIHEKRREYLQKQGLSGKELERQLGSISETADLLYRTQRAELDRLAEEKRKKLEQLAEGSKKSSSQVGSKAVKEAGNLSSKFKEHLDEKRKLASSNKEKNETKTEGAKEAQRQQNAGKESVSDKKALSLKDALKKAKQIQQARTETSTVSRLPKEQMRGKDVKTYHEIDYYQPQVRGVKVKSYEHLREIVDKDFPGCKRIKDFEEFMEGGRKHLELGERLQGKKYLEYGDIARFARELDQDIASVQDWTVKRKPTKIYTTLETAISKSEGEALTERLIRENNGIRSMEDVDRRLGHYYAEKEYRGSRNYNKDREMARKYFRFLDLVKEGGSSTEIARQLDTGWSEVARWNKGHAPWMIQLASSIPDATPKEGCVWLPMLSRSKNNPGEFIEVPLKVTSYHQIEEVLKQIKSLDNEDVRRLENQFGPSSMIDSFMYTLGTLLSDGSSHLAKDANLAGSTMQQPLGRNYDWSITYGEGTRYHLSKIGIRMNRYADREYNPDSVGYPSSGSYDWGTQRSSLITWMRRSCFGLEDSDSKTYNSINAQWILSAPKDWRESFLRGVCDGDGCASIKRFALSIATSANTEFYIDLLKSFGIDGHKGDGAVIINAQDSIRKADEIEMFRYATGRKKNLEKMCRMMDTYDHSRKLTESEVSVIRKMRSGGKSWGSISEALYDEFGHTLPYYSIKRRANKIDIE